MAALVIANGVTGPDNVRAALESTAEDKGAAGWDEEYGWGLVNASAALKYSLSLVLVHDVAVTNISAPSPNLLGDNVSVSVSVSNQGDFSESFLVFLTDTTDSVEIDNQLVSLPVGGTANLTFNWDTTFRSPGDHILLADADVVTEESDIADNTKTTTVTLQEPVHDVAVIAFDAPLGANPGDLVSVSVTVENQGTFAETTIISVHDQTRQ